MLNRIVLMRRQITRYCAGEYWLCPLCEAVDRKYARREEEGNDGV